MLKETPMLPDTAASKVTAAHLSRTALLYVRQSSLKQVIHNTESAIRQYDLRGKAIALGWDASQITVIDIDQGHSGASAADREGFQQLVAEVSLGRAGIVLGLECSRLARNSADWHQLLELCGMTGTLICDEDGMYDPRNFNDRLLLGMKGQMSEAELHFIRARLRGGIISKARRGELITPLPVGLVYDAAGHVILDPDTAVRGALAHLFATFAATGSATACVKAFNTAGLSFPWRHRAGPRKGEIDWKPLAHHVVLRILHNPRYAGAFTFGRHRDIRLPGGRLSRTALPRQEWISFIPGAHPGYITLQQYDANRARIRQLVTDLPAIWNDPATPARERKRIARLLLTDVTVTRTRDTITAHVRLPGGQHHTLTLPIPPTAAQLRKTPAAAVTAIDGLLDHHTHAQIAGILNDRGLTSGEGRPFHRLIIRYIRDEYGLRSREQRLRDAGMLTLTQMAGRLGVPAKTVKIWHHAGLITGHPYNDKGECLYPPPGPNPPTRAQRRKLSEQRPADDA